MVLTGGRVVLASRGVVFARGGVVFAAGVRVLASRGPRLAARLRVTVRVGAHLWSPPWTSLLGIGFDRGPELVVGDGSAVLVESLGEVLRLDLSLRL